jgi:hypothetical protein
LELSDIDVEGTIETEGSSQGGDDLGNETVEVGVGGAFDVEGATADVVDGFVVEDDGNISVLEESVGAENGVVGLNDSSGDLRRRVHSEAELGLLAVVNGQAFEQKRAETRTSTTANRVEDEEALETSAVVSEFADAVEGEVDDFLANGVVTTSVVVSSIFLAGDELFGVVELTVSAGTDFVNDSGFQVEVHSARNVLASASLRKESVESVITTSNGLVGGHLTVRLNTVLEAVKLPAGITNLDTSLTNVNGDDFAHDALSQKV